MRVVKCDKTPMAKGYDCEAWESLKEALRDGREAYCQIDFISGKFGASVLYCGQMVDV